MKIMFYDEEKYQKFYKNIQDNFFKEPFDLFGQRVMIYTMSATARSLGVLVELDIVQVD